MAPASVNLAVNVIVTGDGIHQTQAPEGKWREYKSGLKREKIERERKGTSIETTYQEYELWAEPVFPSFDNKLCVIRTLCNWRGPPYVARQPYGHTSNVRERKWTHRESRCKDAGQEFTESPQPHKKHQRTEAPKLNPSQASPSNAI